VISLKPAALSSSSKSLASPRGSLKAGGGPVGCWSGGSWEKNNLMISPITCGMPGPSGAFQELMAATPPGFSTRYTSLNPFERSGNKKIPKFENAASTLLSSTANAYFEILARAVRLSGKVEGKLIPCHLGHEGE